MMGIFKRGSEPTHVNRYHGERAPQVKSKAPGKPPAPPKAPPPEQNRTCSNCGTCGR